ncbi:hypothetical protein RFI_04535 [Reticulomyxa filosa]|uniref:Protein kinase domain-containing protein n=1 Tax=Reticulomyxa filosa TaxID=46433 RepID=X6P4S1_RETFI|nr:hypothetical protein RFI_04535 [Reticulomyxa filosa]|eukprot:ETO32582.1 hypothetical protein RFI_04535 [Reticulomyxa filosa]
MLYNVVIENIETQFLQKGTGTPNESIWPGVSKLRDFKPNFPNWKAQSWTDVFRGSNLDSGGINLIERMLMYSPNKRITAKEALLHPWFDDIRESMLRKLEKSKSMRVNDNKENDTVMSNSNKKRESHHSPMQIK